MKTFPDCRQLVRSEIGSVKAYAYLDVLQAQGCRVSFSEEESQQLRGLIRRLDELGEVASQLATMCVL